MNFCKLSFLFGVATVATVPFFSTPVFAAESFTFGSGETFENMAAAQEAAKSREKVAIVFATQPWCGACKKLKDSVNEHTGFMQMVTDGEVIVTAIDGDDNNRWNCPGDKDSYVPRVFFIDNKGKLHCEIQGPNKDYKRFFVTGQSIVDGIQRIARTDDDL